jgi:hypothetical protein
MKIQMLGATLEPVYQVLEAAEFFNFGSCNPRIPAPPAKSGLRSATRRGPGQSASVLPAQA